MTALNRTARARSRSRALPQVPGLQWHRQRQQGLKQWLRMPRLHSTTTKDCYEEK